MGNSIEKNLIKFALNVKFGGLFKAIQLALFGNKKNVCPRGCKW